MCGRSFQASSTSMKQCASCGSSMSEDSIFCANCSKKFGEEKLKSTIDEIPTTSVEQKTTTPSVSNNQSQPISNGFVEPIEINKNSENFSIYKNSRLAISRSRKVHILTN
jgi:hypothetical protein